MGVFWYLFHEFQLYAYGFSFHHSLCNVELSREPHACILCLLPAIEDRLDLLWVRILRPTVVCLILTMWV